MFKILPCLLNFQLQHEKAELEQHLEQEQEFQVNKLMKKIKKLENDTISKQLTLEQVTPYFENYVTVKQGILKKNPKLVLYWIWLNFFKYVRNWAMSKI